MTMSMLAQLLAPSMPLLLIIIAIILGISSVGIIRASTASFPSGIKRTDCAPNARGRHKVVTSK